MATFSEKVAQRITKLTSPKRRSQHQDVIVEDEDVFDKLEIGLTGARKSDKVRDPVKTRKPKILTTTVQKSDKSDAIPQKLDKQATGGKVDKSTAGLNVQIDDKCTCHECKTEGHKFLANCEICEKRFCGKCQHLKMDVLKLLASCKTVHWFCTSCDELGVDAISNAKLDQTVPTAQQQNLVLAINKAMTSLQDTVKMAEEKLQLSYADMVKKLDSNIKKIAEPSPSEGRPTSTDLRELQERQERSKNLVIYGIPESTSDNRENRKTHDQAMFQSICQEGLEIEVDVVDTIRLGEKKAGMARPLRVKLPEENDARRILRQAKNLARSEEEVLRKTFVRKDMTPTERREDYLLRTELKKKRAESTDKEDGKHWIIRRGNIVDVSRLPSQSGEN